MFGPMYVLNRYLDPLDLRASLSSTDAGHVALLALLAHGVEPGTVGGQSRRICHG